MNEKHAREARIVNRNMGGIVKRDRAHEVVSEVLPVDFDEASIVRRTPDRIYFRKIVTQEIDGHDVETEVIDSIPRILTVTNTGPKRVDSKPFPTKISRQVKGAHEKRGHRARGKVCAAWRDNVARSLGGKGVMLKEPKPALTNTGAINMRQEFRALSRSKRLKIAKVIRRLGGAPL